jgi:CHAT domain-containing protein/Tfp pilus assembly protein PilF
MTVCAPLRVLGWLPFLAGAGIASAGGVVIGEVQPGFAAHEARLKPGDVVDRWERAPTPPANPDPAAGDVASPFDLEDVEREQAPRGPVTLHGTRGAAPLVAHMPPGDWKMEWGPRLDGAGATAADLAATGSHLSASWLFLKGARAAAGKRDAAAAVQAFADALREAETAGDLLAVASVQDALGRYHEGRSEWDQAVAAFHAALAAHRARGSAGLGEAWAHTFLGIIARKRGDLATAEAELRQALALRETLAPGSLAVASTLGSLGIVARNHGDLAAAEEYQRRALEIRDRLAPDSLDVASGLNNLGVVLMTRSDLAGAEDHFRRALAIREKLQPDTIELATVLNNIGAVAEARGDLPTAEDFYHRAMAIHEKDTPRGLGVSTALTNLGNVTARRGDFAAADAYLQQSLAIKEKAAPKSVGTAVALTSTAFVAWKRGLLARAREHAERSLALYEQVAPTSVGASDTWELLGDVAQGAGDRAAAESHYLRSLEIRRRIAPGTAFEAEASQRLAALRRRQGRREEALALYQGALDALDGQRRMLGGTDEARSRFTARYAGIYREALDTLMDLGRPREAFHVLERYRARGLLSMLAERDLVFTADVPDALDRERRRLNAAYDQAFARLGEGKGGDADAGREALAAIRRQQAAVQERIRAASPRLAELQYPQPLDLAGVRESLDPGTLLLSYSIGEDTSYLFAVGPGPDEFTAAAVATNLAALRDEVTAFRQLLQSPRALGASRLRAAGRRLGRVLLGPVAERIGRAERVLVLPDGPLHLIPFGALGDPSGRSRYLVQTRPVHVAASATVFAEVRKRRRPGRTASLVAFGDPDYPALPGAASPSASVPGLRSARSRGLDLRPLPATRREIAALRSLYASTARTYVGAEATEERAKAVEADTSLLHFACHGLADERSPLESSLALSVPADWRPGHENGLLQAWEIFESVRIDADLVTLSACSTAMGREMSGEGVLGLTRAFQYAGARSVLASLWEVADDSAAELMKRFYRHLKAGRSKDEALRAAQSEMIGRAVSTHPHRWAAFQLVGDWQ